MAMRLFCLVSGKRRRQGVAPWALAVLGLIALAGPARAGEPWNPAEPIAPINAPFAMPQLARPAFPDRTVSIADFGAVADGRTNNGAAFKKAIEACAAKGGGHVLVPAGKWLTGPIHLKSNIDLRLAKGTEIIFSDKFADYLPPVLVRVGGIELYNYSPLIYANGCTNVAVTGPGTLNGNAKAWWPWQKKQSPEIFQLQAKGIPVEKRVFGTPEAAIRPSFVSFINCKNVLLEGFTIGSGPNWTLHPVYCENVIIRRVNIDTHGPNNDGIDPDSCRNVLVERCTFNTGDDCMVIKSGYNEDGWRVGRPTENVVMRECSSKVGHGGLVIGSEMSGGVRNVYMTDCQFDGTDCAIRIKSRPDRGGVVENVWADGVEAKNLKRQGIILTMEYNIKDSKQKPAAKAHYPVFRHFDFKNIKIEGAQTAVLIAGIQDAPESIRDIHISKLNAKADQGVVIRNAKKIDFSDVRVVPAKGPVFDLKNTEEVKTQ